MVIVDEFSAGITGGVDTHLEVHVAAALDPVGGLLGVESFEAGRAGEDKLITWLQSFGPVAVVGVEGTGSYGAGLARRFRIAEIDMVEVDRPNRQARYRHGKTDPLDAVEAARAAQGGRAVGQAKTRDGNVEAIRVLLVARRSARSARIKALNQIRHLGFCAPDELRERLQGVSALMLGRTAAALRPRTGSDSVLYATKTSIRTLGRRVVTLDEEIKSIERLLTPLVTNTAPDLLALHGVGVDTAATLLVDNPARPFAISRRAPIPVTMRSPASIERAMSSARCRARDVERLIRKLSGSSAERLAACSIRTVHCWHVGCRGDLLRAERRSCPR